MHFPSSVSFQSSYYEVTQEMPSVQDLNTAAEASDEWGRAEAWAHLMCCAWLSLATAIIDCCQASDFKEGALERTYNTFCFSLPT